MTTISITELELAVNACKARHPPVDYALGPELRAFGAIYGNAIYGRLLFIDLNVLTPEHSLLVEYWLSVAKEAAAKHALTVGQSTP